MEYPTESSQPIITVSITLKDASTWRYWMANIKSTAVQCKVWEVVDPSKDEETVLTEVPLLVAEDIPDDHRGKVVALANHHRKEREYIAKIKALASILTYIQRSIATNYQGHIEDNTTPYQALRSLKLALEPDSNERALEIDRQYRELCNGPPRNTNINQWVSKWEAIHKEAVQTQHSDISTRLINDRFIQSVNRQYPY